jgi:hypothetical protein
MSANIKVVSKDARGAATALLLGIAMWAASFGLEGLLIPQPLQTPPHFATDARLSEKKSCILLAWHEHSAGIDRATCAQYLAKWNAHQQTLAKSP